MKTIILCVVFWSLYSRADMVITEIVENHGRTKAMILTTKGDRIRTDVSPQMSIITDIATGDTLTLLHTQKSYTMVSGTTTSPIKEQKRTSQGGPGPAETPVAKPKLLHTGKSQKPDNTDIYTADTPAAKFTFWVTKDFPNFAAVKEQLNKFQTCVRRDLDPLVKSAPDTNGLQGLTVKTQIASKGNTLTIVISSAEEKAVEDAEMAPPPGYTKIQTPVTAGTGTSAWR